MSLNFKNVTIAFAVVAVLLAASGGIYFVASGGLERPAMTYHGNGGTMDGEEKVITYEHIAWGVDFVNPGYVLKSWNTKADGTGTEYAVGDYISYDKSIDVYAQWADRLEYNVIYVSSISDETELMNKFVLNCGEVTVELNKYTYIVTKEDTAYLTIETEGMYWDITTDGNKGFFGDSGDITGMYYYFSVGVMGSTGLSVTDGRMNIDMTYAMGNIGLSIAVFQYDASDESD